MIVDGDEAGTLARLGAELGAAEPGRVPPVERWNPPFCGDIPMRITRDGSWHYGGSPIARPALVRLFGSVLRRDGERYVLVTPVERVGIAVDDLPFLAVAMASEGTGEARRLAFRTNLDELVVAGPDHPLRFDRDATGGTMPAIRVRGDLWARLTRAVTFDLLDLAEERNGGWGIAAGGMFVTLPAEG